MSNIHPSLGYRDAEAAIRFLVDIFGFEELNRHDGPDGVIHHAALRWPHGGVIHIHTAESDGSSVAGLAERAAADGGYPAFSMHIDVEDPDTLYDRALNHAVPVVRELQDSPHGVGTRGFIVSDPEGLYWSFGTPLPELVRLPDGRWVPASETRDGSDDQV